MKETQDFRAYLKRELEQRMNRNPRYSLRAFAKDMKVAPALMSDVLNGKRGLSRISALHLAERLGMSIEETEIFCDLVESRHARSKLAREQAKSRLKEKVQQGVVLHSLSLNQEKFNLLADWYHLAILELMKTPNYQNDATWIAGRLGLTAHQTRSALDRMLKLGVTQKQKGKYVPSHQTVETPDGISSQAMKQHHEQFLKKANEALYTQALDERDFRGLTIQCKRSDVKRVREKIKRFLTNLNAEMSKDTDGDEVYQLSTQFFCLTNNQSQEKS